MGGSVVLPSIWCSHFQGFTNPHTFDPDRFSPERAEDIKFSKHYMPFGVGPHLCLGREYAKNHIACFLSLFSMLVDWEHHPTEDSEKIVFLPTIYPKDGCIVSMK